MNFYKKLELRVQASNSWLCMGLDPVIERLPQNIVHSPEGVFLFLESIIQKTHPFVAAYKPNFAYFEAMGSAGMEVLQQIVQIIPDDIPVIGDAKRGDVGHSSVLYAKAVFETFACDAITVNPYQGKDALMPFLEYEDKGVFVLCLTSNQGSQDFQIPNALYLEIAKKMCEWNTNKNIGLVVGATRPEFVSEIRSASGPMPFLIPGVGAQGGALKATLDHVADGTSIPCIINASRSLLYASSQEDFAAQAAQAAQALKEEISNNLPSNRSKQ